MTIFAAVNINVMKYQKTIITILLNLLFCAALIWFFSRNSYLRPYAGRQWKEALSGVILLATLYFNYFLLYPMLIINRHSNILYWLVVVLMSIAIGVLEMAIAYPFISKCNVHIIEKYGFWHYYSKHTFMIVSRNVAFNFFPFMFGERKQLHEALDAEVRFIYKNAQMLDVCDDQNNCLHIPVDNILYCSKNGNETEVYTVDGEKHTRYCTLKYLIQLLGNGEFIRISSSVIVPFQHIASCDGKAVALKSVPWSKTPLSFQLDTKRAPQIAATIDEYLNADHE